MTTPLSRENPFPATPSPPEGPEGLSLQATEDWLFAYANARSLAARETMWPHLVESVEALICEFRHLCARQKGQDLDR